MKDLMYKLWVKIVAVVLLFIFIVIGALSVYAWIEAEKTNMYNYYDYNEFSEDYITQLIEDDAESYADGAISMVEITDGNIDEAVSAINNYSLDRFVMIRANNQLMLSNYNYEAYASKYTFTKNLAYPFHTNETIPFDINMFDPYAFAYTSPDNINSTADFISPEGVMYSTGEVYIGHDGIEYTIDENGQMFSDTVEYINKKVEVTVFLTEQVHNDIATNYYNNDGSVYRKILDLQSVLPVVLVISILLSMVVFIFLVISSGKKQGYDGVYLNWFNRIPLEIVALVECVIIVISIEESYNMSIVSMVFYPFAMWITLLAIISFTVRIKTKRWYETTIAYRIFNIVRKIFKKACASIEIKIPLVAKIITFSFIMLFISLIGGFIFGFLFVNLICIFIFTTLLCIAITWINQMEKQTKLMVNGNFDTKINTQNMYYDFKELAERINNIGEGLTIAVDEKIKSERMKTELIANVSHDIKTPLTSIINYVDLIKQEDCDNENIVKYIEVLDRQSKKLDSLVKDVVHATKISSGNIEVDLTRIDLCVVFEQLKGEYLEKFEQSNLDLIITKPTDSVFVMVDERHIQRIFDNLIGNILKYSLCGTRVYMDISLSESGCNVIIKNTSKDQLNINSDELMERFVRGDSARTSDGNGLGLSIAKSLATAQNIGFNLMIDGDLFKVRLEFEVV